MFYTIEFIENCYCVLDSNKVIIKAFECKRNAIDYVEYLNHFELLKLLMTDY